MVPCQLRCSNSWRRMSNQNRGRKEGPPEDPLFGPAASLVLLDYLAVALEELGDGAWGEAGWQCCSSAPQLVWPHVILPDVANRKHVHDVIADRKKRSMCHAAAQAKEQFSHRLGEPLIFPSRTESLWVLLKAVERVENPSYQRLACSADRCSCHQRKAASS